MDARTKAIIQEHVGELRWQAGKKRAQQLVRDTEQAERSLTRVQWAWGDLSLEIVPLAPKGGSQMLSAVLLEAFLEEYKVPFTKDTLHSLRQTAAAWPKDRRKRASFAVHKTLKTHPDRFRLITDTMTVAEARAIMGHRTPTRSAYSASAVECANAARSWAKAIRRRLPNEEVSEELLTAITAAWEEISTAATEIGIYDELIARFEAIGLSEVG